MRAGALAPGAFDAASFPHLPFSLIEEIKQPVFHAIWLEIAGKPPRKISPEKVAGLLHCRTAASSVISGGAGQVHYSFDNDEKGFSRALLFNDSISPSRMGRVILRMVELETYRMLALLGLPVIRQYGAEVSGIETQLKNLTSAISALISDASEQAGSLLPQLSLRHRLKRFQLKPVSDYLQPTLIRRCLCPDGTAEYLASGWSSGVVWFYWTGE